jgi:hypothetical protein
MEGYLFDCEQLALKFSFGQVRDALASLRIRPGQAFFPRPDEVAAEIERQLETRRHEYMRRESQRQSEEQEAWFWTWVEERVQETGMTEQEVLDQVKVPGYMGRKARRPARN